MTSFVKKLNWILKNPGYLAYRLLAIFRRKDLRGSSVQDDFDWDLYTIHYKAELNEEKTLVTQILKSGDYIFKKGVLERCNLIKPALHPNHHLLYETILLLSPSSLIEFGCGGGDHLSNLSLLDGSISITGLDLSESQIELLNKRHPYLRAKVYRRDITSDFIIDGVFGIAYSQAVLMHIQKGNSHLKALENMFKYSSDQVVLMENWRRHQFMSDIKKLHLDGLIEWKELFFYYRELKDLPGTKIMIISSVKLKDLDLLRDYDIMLLNS